MIGEEPTNRSRADWALEAVEAFRTTHAQEDDLDTNIKDLVTDLCHVLRLDLKMNQSEIENFLQTAANMHDMEATEDEDE